MGKKYTVIVVFLVFFSIYANALSVKNYFYGEPQKQLNQVEYGDLNACGPFSILYALKFGNSALQTAYNRLPGETDKEKMQFIINTASQTHSMVLGYNYIYMPGNGINDFDVPLLIQTTTSQLEPIGYKRMQFVRQNHENHPGVFATRAYREIRNSLEQGYPIIAGVFGEQYDSEKHTWDRKFAHAVTILGLQEDFLPGESQFAISYYEPWTGRYLSGFLYEETRQSFSYDQRDLISGIVKVTRHGESNPDTKVHIERNEQISSPFLLLQSPSFYSGYAIDADKREILVLDNVNMYFDF